MSTTCRDLHVLVYATRHFLLTADTNLLTCPVRALDAWMQAARMVKTYAARIGLDADRYGAHSLRAGLATSAAEAGVSERAIMNQTGHRSLPVMRGYIRSGTLFKENAAAQVGL